VKSRGAVPGRGSSKPWHGVHLGNAAGGATCAGEPLGRLLLRCGSQRGASQPLPAVWPGALRRGYTIIGKDRYGCASRRQKGTSDNARTRAEGRRSKKTPRRLGAAGESIDAASGDTQTALIAPAANSGAPPSPCKAARRWLPRTFKPLRPQLSRRRRLERPISAAGQNM
jgi:hypothetical protein